MEKQTPLGILKTLGCGLLLGISNAIPGVSGGTMAVILNIYDKMLSALSIKEWKKHLDFLIPLFLGCIGGVFALSRTIIPLIKDYPMAVGFSFMGLILGSLPVIARHAFNDGFKPKLYNIALGLFCLGIMITMSYMEKSKLELNSGYNFKNMNYQLFFVLIITSSIAAIAMIIPGISGSLVMLMLGTYTIVIKGIGNVDFAILIPTALGVLLGLGIGISGIKKAMTYFPQAMYFSILGLVTGSLWPVFPGFKPGVEGFVSIGCMLLFMFVSFYSSRPRK